MDTSAAEKIAQDLLSLISRHHKLVNELSKYSVLELSFNKPVIEQKKAEIEGEAVALLMDISSAIRCYDENENKNLGAQDKVFYSSDHIKNPNYEDGEFPVFFHHPFEQFIQNSMNDQTACELKDSKSPITKIEKQTIISKMNDKYYTIEGAIKDLEKLCLVYKLKKPKKFYFKDFKENDEKSGKVSYKLVDWES